MFVSVSKYEEAVERGNRFENIASSMEKNNRKLTTVINEMSELNGRLFKRNIELIEELERIQAN